MAGTPFATYVDVEARWRTLSDSEQDIADQLAADASGMIRDRWADVDARIAAETLDGDSVIRVVAGMVKRAMLNADAEGLESQTRVAGPFSLNSKFANPMSNLYFTAADILVFEPESSRTTVHVGWLA